MHNVWLPLSHNTILDAVEEVIGDKLSNLIIQRNSYINRVYEIENKNTREKLIVKFYRPDRWSQELILEEHAFLYKLEENEVPVITPLKYKGDSLFLLENIYYAIYPKKGGRAVDEFDKEGWLQIGRLLGRMHLVGETFIASKRVVWKPEVVSQKSVEYLLNNHHLPLDYEEPFSRATNQFILKAKALFEKERAILIHGDCHLGNLLNRLGEGQYLIDFDDICIGPPVQDLWMLLPDKVAECELMIAWFREGYETFREFSLRSLQLIPALKIMRQIHFAGWCALQRADISFNNNFSEWGSIRYWNELVRDIQGFYLLNEM